MWGRLKAGGIEPLSGDSQSSSIAWTTSKGKSDMPDSLIRALATMLTIVAAGMLLALGSLCIVLAVDKLQKQICEMTADTQEEFWACDSLPPEWELEGS